MNEELTQQFKSQAVRHLRVDFLPKIERCLASLSEEEIWWRPNERSNSVGNILLHLSGNVRQWIIAALGGTADTRKRDDEFAAQGPMPAARLWDLLEETVAEAARIIESLGPEQLLEEHRIQIYDVSALQSVFHVVEHFSYHTGQVIYVTKLLKDEDLEFYAELNPKRRFTR